MVVHVVRNGTRLIAKNWCVRFHQEHKKRNRTIVLTMNDKLPLHAALSVMKNVVIVRPPEASCRDPDGSVLMKKEDFVDRTNNL